MNKPTYDELATQVEQLQKLLHVLITDIEWHHRKTAFVPLSLAVKAANFKDATKATPAQCLAEIKARALEGEAQLWPDDLTECSHVRSSLLESANQLRQSAKAGE